MLLFIGLFECCCCCGLFFRFRNANELDKKNENIIFDSAVDFVCAHKLQFRVKNVIIPDFFHIDAMKDKYY